MLVSIAPSSTNLFLLCFFKAELNSHRGDRLKRKIQRDPAVQKGLQIKRRMVNPLEESERHDTERLDKITGNIATTTNTIQEQQHKLPWYNCLDNSATTYSVFNTTLDY